MGNHGKRLHPRCCATMTKQQNPPPRTAHAQILAVRTDIDWNCPIEHIKSIPVENVAAATARDTTPTEKNARYVTEKVSSGSGAVFLLIRQPPRSTR